MSGQGSENCRLGPNGQNLELGVICCLFENVASKLERNLSVSIKLRSMPATRDRSGRGCCHGRRTQRRSSTSKSGFLFKNADAHSVLVDTSVDKLVDFMTETDLPPEARYAAFGHRRIGIDVVECY